ncbi:metal ABC transporter permease [Rubrimonas cliftonensis]|uniref:Manganese/zinc/iron transport system permease protein n=1 Tax=Rubrimonas cliftonensis TaxID=89524 RepID=A0A1H3VU96_9RHOB|nr:metal ABC transporter permease [Rubrimonas cliftonensis]SDZ78320.1 manganese/zinc/iron transport system permease protein [Rubrimonas cliftonensis]
MDVALFLGALALSAGWNTALVTVGAALLGAAAGAAGAFLFLRRRALAADAAAHATLPGVALAFIAMVWMGGDGRWLPGLMLGSAASAALGLWAVEAIPRRTRLGEDAAIGGVLASFFGFGVVLLTVIQAMPGGRQAGLDGFLLGATAGMLQAEALTIASMGAALALATFALRRPMTLASFDPGYAAAVGVNVRAVDLAILALALAVTVTGLKVVGLILIVALLIIPPAAARFWTERVDLTALGAALIGAVSAWIGAALSAAIPGAPTGALVVLSAAALFTVSMLMAPKRGALAEALARRRLSRRVHRRQGLLALARGEAIHDRDSLRALRGEGLIGRDGAPTMAGRAAAAAALRDEARWALARADAPGAPGMEGLRPIAEAFTPDEIAAFDARLGALRLAP